MIHEPKDIALIVLVLIIVALLVVLIIGLIRLIDLNNKKTRVLATIENNIFCSKGDTSSKCTLTPDLELAFPENSNEFSVPIAKFGCTLLACLEVTFRTDPNKAAVLPNGVILISQILFGKKIIALVCNTPGATWIILRGSQSKEDWEQDLMIEQVTSPQFQGLVHKGFLNIYNQIKVQIFDVLIKENPQNHLYIIGHSLGASLAQLLLADSTFVVPFTSKEVYVFGSPRIGNQTFATSLNGLNIFRYTNLCDIVCELPPPVTPNFIGDKNDVFLYFHNQKVNIDFTDNRSSYYQNHALQCYLTFLNK
jgi:hypothetical protein